jgi:hypothetical protein
LEESVLEKDLSVNINSELNFSKHIEIQVDKANRILGLIRRSLEFLNVAIMKTLFGSHLKFMSDRHLKFWNPAWSPRLEKDKIIIEEVLKRATRVIP